MAAFEPGPQGLYDPRYEHDACGVGFIADLKNRRSHQIVQDGLPKAANMPDPEVYGFDTPASASGLRKDKDSQVKLASGAHS